MSVKHHSRWKVFLLFGRRVVLSLSFCFNKHVHEVVTEADKSFQGLSPLAPDGKSKEITKSQLTSWSCSTNRDTLNSLWSAQHVRLSSAESRIPRMLPDDVECGVGAVSLTCKNPGSWMTALSATEYCII